MTMELLKSVLCLKLSLADGLTEVLPDAIQGPVKDLEKLVIQALYDVTKEYVNQELHIENSEQTGGLKAIDVL